MFPKVVHTLIPVIVILCATALLIAGKVDTTTALTMISASGAYGAGAVIRPPSSKS